MKALHSPPGHRVPWNKGKLTGQKPPLKLQEIRAIRTRLQMSSNVRELAMFNFAIDSKLRACDLIRLHVHEICHGSQVSTRGTVLQQKTQRPVQFEITAPTRASVQAWIEARQLKASDFLFPTRLHSSPHLSTRQYSRLVHRWIASIGLDDSAYGTHTMRRTKASLIYRRTNNLRAVQLLLGHTKVESTVRYLGIDVDDALEIAEQTSKPKFDKLKAGEQTLADYSSAFATAKAVIPVAGLPRHLPLSLRRIDWRQRVGDGPSFGQQRTSREVQTWYPFAREETVMETLHYSPGMHVPWNKGKLTGQKPPLKLSEIWAIRTRLQMASNVRELAMFNLAIDSKLRACDFIRLHVQDIAHGNEVTTRATVLQQKTQRPVQFEITAPTRESLTAWIKAPPRANMTCVTYP